jgi:hypothetical protein
MADLDDEHDEPVVLDRVDDPIDALSNPIEVATGELLAALWTGIFGQAADSIRYLLPVPLARKRLELSGCRRLDEDFKSCHAASGP